MPTRPTWAEVSLAALIHNFRLIRDFVAPHATVCAVVKCDAYGHGAAECTRALEAAGAKWFGVTSAAEGIELRQAGITARILLMSGIWQGEAEEQLANYQQALEQLAAAELRPACLHLANSAAVIAHKTSWHGLGQTGPAATALVRPGIALYGYYLPFVTAAGERSDVQQLRV